jgi:hypothetical protein
MVQMAWNQLDEAKQFTAQVHHRESGDAMLMELAKWASALKTMRH